MQAPKSISLRPAFLLSGLFALTAFASWGCLLIDDSGGGGQAAIWFSNAILLSALLLNKRSLWPALFATSYLANVVAHITVHHSLPISLALPVCDMVEVAIASYPFIKDASGATSFSRLKELARLYAMGAVVGPTVSAALAAGVLHANHVPVPFSSSLYWFFSNALATVGLAPIILAVFDRETYTSFRRIPLTHTMGVIGLTAICSFLVLRQGTYPLLFLLFPPLLLMVVRLGIGGGMLGVSIITGFSIYFTLHGRGPLTPVQNVPWWQQIFFTQILLASMVLCVALVAVVLNELRWTEKVARKSERLYRLLAENSRDIIVLTDLNHKREYISPAVQWTMGWDPQELTGTTFEESVVHPDDINALRLTLEALKNGEPAKTLTYRCQKKDGAYLWMEAHISLYCDRVTGTPIGYVNVVRNVAERKAAEERLHDAYVELETLAAVDGLTGVANRRHFDEVLTQEWRRAIRMARPISLLLLDVDHFKLYNDLYGHLRGDSCLRQIAEAALDVVQRPSDTVARFGGEEFSVILSESDASEAQAMAEKIRLSVASRMLEHNANGPGIVTVSLGCATLIPRRGSNANVLIEAADQALYEAKRAGRNTVVVAVNSKQI